MDELNRFYFVAGISGQIKLHIYLQEHFQANEIWSYCKSVKEGVNIEGIALMIEGQNVKNQFQDLWRLMDIEKKNILTPFQFKCNFGRDLVALPFHLW